MAVKIKLKRMGKIRAPYYRVIVADARTKRDGRAIEEIGKYHPTHDPSIIEIDTDRAQHWLSVGAQPTEAVLALFKVTGDWQKFKGLPGAEGTLKVAEPRVRQGTVDFVATGLDAGAGPRDGATTAKKRATKQDDEAAAAPEKAPEQADDAAKPEEPAAASPAAEPTQPPADAPAEQPPAATEEAAAAQENTTDETTGA